VTNGFTSNDSSEIHFSDTIDENLIVLQQDGSNALATFFADDSGLLIEFDFIASALSMDFGNTPLDDIGDNAVLTVLMGGFEVGSTVLALNAIDKTISYAGVSFDSAILRYEVASGWIEVVDNIEVTRAGAAVPEPTAGLVFGIGALLIGAACGRRSPAEVKLRVVHD
jgi:hypothetical protein